MSTIYKCIQRDPRTGAVSQVHYAETEREALQWLSDNGGGTYRNVLHRFEMYVKPGEFKRQLP